ncbi:MAG TPA: prepilin-type N-terminal cleavage/methylation domain-containing protein [Longimicrobiales bacterium]
MMRNRKGFTLIELLIVVVIIGILAAIAIPKFSSAREKAYYSAIKSDLKNLSTQQEVYYSGGEYTYTTDQAKLEYVASKGVHVDFANMTANTTGWAVSATHDGLGNFGCAIYYGSGVSITTPASKAVTQAGVVTCDDES